MLTLIGPFCVKYITCELKKYRGVIFHDTQESCKFEEKQLCGLEIDMKNLADFHQSTRKFQNWDFDGILLSRVENAWSKIF